LEASKPPGQFLLARRGNRIDVYEKRPDMRRVTVAAGRSINLALAERGMHALQSAGLTDEVKPLLIPMTGRMLHDIHGTLDLSPYGQRPNEVIYSVSRGLLNQVMLSAAETSNLVQLHFDHECVDLDLTSRRLNLVDLKTGERTERSFDYLIGTDGANSIVRDKVVRAGGGDWTMDWLDHDYKELTIPAGADGQHQMEKNALHIWPRHGYMLIALPNLDGSFTVTLFLNKEGDPSFARLTDLESVESFFATQFPDAKQLIPSLDMEFFGNPTGTLGTVRCSAWTSGGPTLLLGDAAHAIVPFQGQGMNAGFEDCEELMKLLDEHDDDWDRVPVEFQNRRIPNLNAIADMALENYVTMRDLVLDPRFQLKKLVGFELERRMPNRFIPRYSMIMFHTIPYAEVFARGQIQERILDEITEGCTRVEEIDFEIALAKISKRLPLFASQLSH
jgi:kynurenine 3-monooxygenase